MPLHPASAPNPPKSRSIKSRPRQTRQLFCQRDIYACRSSQWWAKKGKEMDFNPFLLADKRISILCGRQKLVSWLVPSDVSSSEEAISAHSQNRQPMPRNTVCSAEHVCALADDQTSAHAEISGLGTKQQTQQLHPDSLLEQTASSR